MECKNINKNDLIMGFYRGPNLVTNGLVLALDAGNIKSYPGSGTTWLDKSGYGNNGTLTNGPTFDSGNGGSIVFDGSNDRVIGTNILSGSAYSTLGGWVKKTATSSHMSFGVLDNEGVSSTDKRIEIVWYINGLLYAECGDNHNVWVNTTPPKIDTNWHHICFTYDGTKPTNYTKIQIYFDGNPLSPNGQSGTIPSTIPTTGPVVIGRRNTGHSNGNISQVQIYNTALTAQEILQNYNATKSRFNL